MFVKLTPAERWWVWRHRLRLNQLRAAKRAKLTRSLYQRVELEVVALTCPHPLGRVTLPEQLRVLRRRSKLGLSGVARGLGVSRPHVHKLEARGDAVLVKFWEERLLDPTKSTYWNRMKKEVAANLFTSAHISGKVHR